MKGDYGLDKRQYVIGGVAVLIIVIYLIRLFTLQILSDDYKKNADSNAFLKKIEFPPECLRLDGGDERTEGSYRHHGVL